MASEVRLRRALFQTNLVKIFNGYRAPHARVWSLFTTLLTIVELENDRTNKHIDFSIRTTEQMSSPAVARDLDTGIVEDFTTIIKFMGEDPDRIVFRRFPRANLYNLLTLQHRLTLIDQKIASYEVGENAEALMDILPALESSVKDYNKALLLYCGVSRITETPRYVVETLQVSAEPNIIELKNELDPQDGWNELMSLAATRRGWAHKIVERHGWLQKLFRQPERGDIRSSLFTYSDKNVRRAEEALLNLAFCILVIAPIFALSYISQKSTKLVVVLVFVCTTSVIASYLSDMTQKTSLALMAGYTAILVVFLSNNIVAE